MSEISSSQYWDEIQSIADNMVSEVMAETDNDRDAAEDIINDSRLHETCDGHQWVIYYAYNDDVLRHTDNEDYYADNFGAEDMGRIVAEQGLDSLKTAMAFFAMYADVQDKLSDAFDAFEDEPEAA